jgi:hypothetical protein
MIWRAYKSQIYILAGAAYAFYYLATLKEWHFIDYVNLIIHEAGHFVFLPFGDFLTIAGGSLLQILMPVLFVWYFYKTSQKTSALLVLYWVAINLFNVGYYAADAQTMQLPLLGGDAAGHDWNNLLSMTGLLAQAKLVGSLFYFAGIVITLTPLYFLCDPKPAVID